jgi:hypothetical protein
MNPQPMHLEESSSGVSTALPLLAISMHHLPSIVVSSAVTGNQLVRLVKPTFLVGKIDAEFLARFPNGQ